MEVSRVKIRDRGTSSAADRICFTSAILPKSAGRTKSLDALLPILYLRGLSTGDFQEALSALLGKDAPNLSPSAITRLTCEWQGEYEHWQARDLSARRYVYVWADSVYLQPRMEDQAECILVLIGATPEGKKELVGFQVGVRESAQSWRELLVEIKRRGLSIPPCFAVGDGALSFSKALDGLFAGTHHQQCWLHKTVNVLNKVPKLVQPGRLDSVHEPGCRDLRLNCPVSRSQDPAVEAPGDLGALQVGQCLSGGAGPLLLQRRVRGRAPDHQPDACCRHRSRP